jgi:hypothetical protein
VENRASVWTAACFLWTKMWTEEIVEKSSGKPLRGVVWVT